MAFKVLCADPPWKFGDQLPGEGRGAEKNYPCMTVEQICSMELPPLEENAWLFLWRVSSMQQEALDVVKAWGFIVKSEIVWEKLTKHGKPHFGMGRYVRASHETCLLAVRGRVQPAVRNIRSRFAAPCPTDAAGRVIHSAKPEHFYREIVEKLVPGGPFAEMFARRFRDGWVSLGNELGDDPMLDAAPEVEDAEEEQDEQRTV